MTVEEPNERDFWFSFFVPLYQNSWCIVPVRVVVRNSRVTGVDKFLSDVQ